MENDLFEIGESNEIMTESLLEEKAEFEDLDQSIELKKKLSYGAEYKKEVETDQQLMKSIIQKSQLEKRENLIKEIISNLKKKVYFPAMKQKSKSGLGVIMI